MDQCIRIISPIDQDAYKSKIPPCLDYEDPEFYWIFKNLDFERWKSGNSRVLWLSAPQERKLEQVASHFVDLEKNTINSEYDVLYFFCWSAAGKRLGSSVFGTFLHQLIRHLAPRRRDNIIIVFLRAILDAYLARKEPFQKTRWWLEDCTPDRMIESFLDASSGNELLEAMKAVLDLEELNIHGLFIIIAGLEKELENKEGKFIWNLCSLIEHLQHKRWKAKVLLTSRPHGELKELLHGLLSIEYDYERKGVLIIPSFPVFI